MAKRIPRNRQQQSSQPKKEAPAVNDIPPHQDFFESLTPKNWIGGYCDFIAFNAYLFSEIFMWRKFILVQGPSPAIPIQRFLPTIGCTSHYLATDGIPKMSSVADWDKIILH